MSFRVCTDIRIGQILRSEIAGSKDKCICYKKCGGKSRGRDVSLRKAKIMLQISYIKNLIIEIR